MVTLIRASVVAATYLALLGAPAAGGQAELAQAKALAKEIVRSTGVRAGLCVHVGCGDGRLTAALTAAGNFITHGLALEANSLKAARSHLQSQGIYGRASVEQLGLAPLPYPENAVNLLVIGDLAAARKNGLDFKEALRVLVPNGRACAVGGARSAEPDLKTKLGKAGVRDYRLDAEGPIGLVIRKPRPPGMGQWSHADGSPAGGWVARDDLVGPPRRLKWVAPPLMYLTHFSRPQAWVSGGGRVFYVYDERHPRMAEPGRLNLVARDAFNGKLLWRKPVHVPAKRGRYWSFGAGALVAAGERLYAPMGKDGLLQALDAGTGEVLVDYKLPVRLVRAHGGEVAFANVIVSVVDPETGKPRWSARSTVSCRRVVAGGGNLYAGGRRRNAETRKYDQGIACFDIKTGKEKWWRVMPEPLESYHEGKVIAATKLKLNDQGNQRIVALDGETGEVAWTHSFKGSGRRRLYCIADRLWYAGPGLSWRSVDLATGQSAGELSSYVAGAITHHFTRCTGTNATDRYLVTGNTMDFLDVRTGRHLRSSAARASCLFGLRAANGMVYTFPVDCGCFKSLRGVLGVAPGESDGAAPPGQASPRLVKAAAYGKPLAPAAAADPKADWPCYRHDAARSGCTPSAVPADFKLLWRAPVGPDPTAPTVAGGLAFVAARGTHQLAALDAATGRRRWTFTAGGPIDTPPTLQGGACFFGCRNGWIYALRAADGELIWRFRAAPADRRIIALERLESPVPAYGSVLAVSGTLYASAGRTSELDGGVHVYALEPATGNVKWHANVPRSKLVEGRKLERRILAEQGALGGLLVSDGKHVYMRGWRFDPADGKRKYYYRWRGVVKPSNKGGFLDATMKTPWTYRTSGLLLAFNETTTCGFTALHKEGWKLSYFTHPGKGQYHVFARHFDAKGQPVKDNPGWTVKACPVAVEAMLIAAGTLFLAGPPDAVEPKGGLLWAVGLADGRKLREVRLDAAPVFDGLAGGGGRLYLATRDGKLLCFGKR